MSLVITPGYSWLAGETVTAAKLNAAALPTIANGQAGVFSTISATGNISYNGVVNGGLMVADGTVVGFFIPSSVGTHSLAIGTSTNHPVYILSNNSAVGFFSSTGLNNCILGGTTPALGSFTEIISTLSTARCTADVVKTADTALADLTGMSITVTAAGTYIVRAVIQMATTTTGGFRTTLDGAATATSMRLVDTMTFGAAAGTATSSTSTIAALGSGNNVASVGVSSGSSIIEGTIVVNAGGTLKVQVAQNNAAGVTTFYAGSFMWAQRIS